MSSSRSATWRSFVQLVLGVATCLCLNTAAAQQVSVIASNNSSHEISRSQAKDYFTGANLHWPDGAKVIVVDQPKSDVGELFYKELTGRLPAKVRVQWMKLYLSGQATPPLKCWSNDEAKKAVSGNAHAIGFIATDALDDTVKELIRIDSP